MGGGAAEPRYGATWRRGVVVGVASLLVLAGAATITLMEASVLYGRAELRAETGLAAEPGGWLFWSGAVLVPTLLFCIAFIPWLLIAFSREVETKARTQAALEHARSSLERAEAMAGVGHWRIEYGARGTRVEWSDSIFRLLGHRPQSFLPTPERIIEAYHPEDRDEVRAILARVLDKPEPFQFELRAMRKDGSVRRVVTQGVAETGRGGEVRSLFGVAQDVTEAREQEAKLEAQTEHLRIITEGMSEGVVMLDQLGRVAFWNSAASELFGVSAEHAQGHEFTQVVHFEEEPEPGTTTTTTTLDLVPVSDGANVERREVVDPRGRSRTIEMTRDVLETDDAAHQILIIRDVTRRAKTERELQRRARYDELTGLLNRGYFWRRATDEAEHAQSEGKAVTLLLLDIDHFKRVNDERGHAEGDIALARFARCCTARFRASDLVGRVGGEEFAVLLVGANREAAASAAEDLRTTVESTRIEGQTGTFGLTVCVGVAEVAVDGEGALEEARRRADEALYRAKDEGRNRVRVALPPEAPSESIRDEARS